MKLKKFLRLIKKNCKEENCALGKCPMCYPHKMSDGAFLGDCLFAIENMDEWDIDYICQKAKELER